MASFTPVLLILGSGSNVGASVARAFSAKGYKVAATSRTAKQAESDGVDLHIVSDLSESGNVSSVFQQVSKALGPPSVVVYNASARAFNAKEDPLSLTVESLKQDLEVNVFSALNAAREATAAFAQTPASASRTFIYTGNCLNSFPILQMLSAGIGKSAAAHMMASASKAYESKGYHFYYADERQENGEPMYAKISGDNHADFYAQLADGTASAPSVATFVGGKGYVDFSKSS